MDGARHPNSHTMHPNRVMISFFCCTGIFLTGIFFNVQFAGERRITAYKFRDWKVQRVSINTSLLPGAANRTVGCRFIHIPKCAGTSFIKDAEKILGKENLILLGPYEGEGPYCNSSLGIGDVVLLRNPRHHVLSQFLHCKVTSAKLNYTDNGTNQSNQYSGLKAWLEHCLSASTTSPVCPPCLSSTLANGYNCYNPWNMQSRFFTDCRPYPGLQAFKSDMKPNLTRAKHNLEMLHMIGISDLYVESLCLLNFTFKGMLPETCACGHGNGVIETQVSHETHGVQQHSVADIDVEVLSLMDQMTKGDAQLFAFGLNHFETALRQAEDMTGVKVICEEKISRIWREIEESLKTDKDFRLPDSDVKRHYGRKTSFGGLPKNVIVGSGFPLLLRWQV